MFFFLPNWRVEDYNKQGNQEFRYSALLLATAGGGVGTVLDGEELATEKATKKKEILNDAFN